jgi:hypothetical protein
MGSTCRDLEPLFFENWIVVYTKASLILDDIISENAFPLEVNHILLMSY